MSWERIIVHHSAGHDTPALETEGIRRFHRGERGWRDIGYHFLVELVGETYAAVQGRPLTMVGSHAPGANRTGIGVCFVGDFEHGAMPPEQLEAGADLIASLLVLMGYGGDKRGMLRDLIRPHYDYKSTLCPGKHFPMGQLLRRVEELLAGAEVTA